MLRIRGGKVYDPKNSVNGVVRDVCVSGGKIVADVAAGRGPSTRPAWSSSPAASMSTRTSAAQR